MNNTKYKVKHFAITIFLLFGLPLYGMGQKTIHKIVIEKRDGTEIEFVLDSNPIIYVGAYPNGNVSITNMIDSKWAPVDEVKRIYTKLMNVVSGDVTNSGVVDIQDVTVVIKYILQEYSSAYCYAAADMNNDDEIDVFDVTAMINVILSGNGNSASARDIKHQEKNLESVRLTADRNGFIFGINNAERFTSFQFDVVVPQGADLIGVEWNGDCRHTLQFAQTGENRYTVIGLSMSNEFLPQMNNGLLKLQLSGTVSGDVSVNDVLFVTPQGDATHFSGQSFGMATDIHGVVRSLDDKVYDLSGRYLNTNREQLSKGFYLINNKKVVVK